MNYKHLIVLPFLSVLFLFSCAGNQQIVTEQQSKIDSLISLNAGLHKQLKGQGNKMDRLTKENAAQDVELQEAMSKLAKIPEIKVQGNRTMITNDLLFGSGSYVLTAKGKKILEKIWAVLEPNSSREFFIVGHTDDQPIAKEFLAEYHSNWDLSTWRALAVLHYIEGLPNAHPERFSIAGYGPYQPIASNDTEEGRRQNRRVEIILGLDNGKLKD
ncbi:MAG: flagellar motor protein MotB [Candidatus Marinimicrobia bacterium]|nr:flagellar motor protein MotB [Candidatus Neomarinimicrobiota bacterium]MCF7850372.1 flagellar motor protein MotB [Candidatus Neomarinimicrobiota bacterium]MCF7904497.1 flagellar motor protein MotB [Candidatus Neomarinimicrobiota bacterium]